MRVDDPKISQQAMVPPNPTQSQQGDIGSTALPVERAEEQPPAKVVRVKQSQLESAKAATDPEYMNTKCQLRDVQSSSSR